MDPISDFFTRIQNAYRAKKSTVVVPYSNLKSEIARLLEERGYILGFERKGRKVRKFLEITLRYEAGAPAMSAMRRISKPSRRLYVAKGEIRPVRQGFGLAIISTSKGLMSGEKARQAGVGGEIIAEVW